MIVLVPPPYLLRQESPLKHFLARQTIKSKCLSTFTLSLMTSLKLYKKKLHKFSQRSHLPKRPLTIDESYHEHSQTNLFHTFFFFLLWLVDLFLKIWHQKLKTASNLVLPEGEFSQEMCPRSLQILQVTIFTIIYNYCNKSLNALLKIYMSMYVCA